MGSGEAESAAAFVPDGRDLDALAEAAADCRGCDLYRDATQTVFGDGAAGASVVFLGEQPGDAEDQEGEPFVGPAGRELHRGPRGVVITATVHPASILRAPSDEERHEAREEFHADLGKVADLVHRGVEAALSNDTKQHLYELAQAEDIEGRSSMTKDELAEAVAECIARPEAA